MHLSLFMASERKPVVNRIIKTLIYSDFLLLAAGGFLAPVYAIFVTREIGGGSVAVVGFATTIFWVVKSLAQFPVSWYADQIKGERDDYSMMVVGSAIASLVPESCASMRRSARRLLS